MINKRLFTFGCSFTKYNWPTWADLLATEFTSNFNWGYPGIGNRGISERIAEAQCQYNFNQNDVVIVQWSSYLRHDYARPDIIDMDKMWKTKGNIFSEWNRSVFNEKWIENFWNEKAYYIHTLNSIVLAKRLLESVGCEWYMTSSIDLQNLRDFSDNTKENEPSESTFNVWEMSPELLPYKQEIWSNDKWFPPIIEEKWRSPDLDWWFNIDKKERNIFNYFKQTDKVWNEPHPTPEQYFNYLLTSGLYDKFNIETPNNSAIELVAVYDYFKNNSKNDYQEFINLITKNTIDPGLYGM